MKAYLDMGCPPVFTKAPTNQQLGESRPPRQPLVCTERCPGEEACISACADSKIKACLYALDGFPAREGERTCSN